MDWSIWRAQQHKNHTGRKKTQRSTKYQHPLVGGLQRKLPMRYYYILVLIALPYNNTATVGTSPWRRENSSTKDDKKNTAHPVVSTAAYFESPVHLPYRVLDWLVPGDNKMSFCTHVAQGVVHAINRYWYDSGQYCPYYYDSSCTTTTTVLSILFVLYCQTIDRKWWRGKHAQNI